MNSLGISLAEDYNLLLKTGLVKDHFCALAQTYLGRAISYVDAIGALDGRYARLPGLVLIRGFYENCERGMEFMKEGDPIAPIKAPLAVTYEVMRTYADFKRILMPTDEVLAQWETIVNQWSDKAESRLDAEDFKRFKRHGAAMKSLEQIATANGHEFEYDFVYRRVSKFEHNLDLLVRGLPSIGLEGGDIESTQDLFDSIAVNGVLMVACDMLGIWRAKIEGHFRRVPQMNDELSEGLDGYVSVIPLLREKLSEDRGYLLSKDEER